MNHNQNIVSQFTKQAIPFTKVNGHLDALDLLIKMSGITKQSTVLDVASGPGLVASAFAKYAKHVECLDLTPAMLEQAKNKAVEQGITNMSYCEGDAINLPYEDNSFDTVITRYSFHHFLEPSKVLQEMIRVCKLNGRILVADVALEQQYMIPFNVIERLRDSSHTSALSISEFENLFSTEKLSHCEKSNYHVNVSLEEQLAASFPDAGNDITIRELITKDIGYNKTGFNPRNVNGEVFYSYPISIYTGIKV